MVQICTTLLSDEFGEGIPVWWAISNREAVSLQPLKIKCTGSIKSQRFMSDDAQQYYKAGSGVFDTIGTKNLLYVHGLSIGHAELP